MIPYSIKITKYLGVFLACKTTVNLLVGNVLSRCILNYMRPLHESWTKEKIDKILLIKA